MANSPETRSIDFSLSLDDMVAYAYWRARGSGSLWGQIATWGIPLAVVVSLYLWAQLKESRGLQYEFGLVTVVAAAALISLALNLPTTKMWIKRSIRRSLGAKLRQPERWQFRVMASPEGLRVIHDDVDELIRWRKVADLVEHEDLLLLTIREQTGAIIVPKSAFPCAADYSAFAEAVCAHQQAAKQRG